MTIQSASSVLTVGTAVTFSMPLGFFAAHAAPAPALSCHACGTVTLIATGENNPYKLTSPENGVVFDLNADGVLDQVGWTDPDGDTAFLGFDRNGNGRIDNGRELVGDQTLTNQSSGFAALNEFSKRQQDEKHDGWFDGRQQLFERLLLWKDDNHNGLSESGELQRFSKRFSALSLAYRRMTKVDEFGNSFTWGGFAARRTAPGLNPADFGEEPKRALRIYNVSLNGSPHFTRPEALDPTLTHPPSL